MEEAKTIKVSPRVYAELNAFTGLLSERLKRRVSIDDAFLYYISLIPLNHREQNDGWKPSFLRVEQELKE